MYGQRRVLVEELRKSYLGLAALPPRHAPSAAEADNDAEIGVHHSRLNRLAYGTAIDILPSVAMRKIKPRKRGSKIVSIVDPFRRREIIGESGLEEAVILVKIASSDLLEICEQQRPTMLLAARRTAFSSTC